MACLTEATILPNLFLCQTGILLKLPSGSSLSFCHADGSFQQWQNNLGGQIGSADFEPEL